jgi:EmrB/QacA subfamily drug resistance transporter
MSSPRSTSTTGAGPRSLGWVIAPLALAQLIIALDIYIVFVAMPQMGAELGFTDQNLQLVVSAYAVAFGGFLLLGGRAADLFGKRRMFLLALGLYGVSSLVGGFAGDPVTIIIVRAVQGLGGALLFPTTLSLVNTLFEEGKQRNRALAIWGGAGATGLTLGSLLGGLLTGAWGWASVFFVNVPLSAAIAILALVLIPADSAPRGQVRRRFDLPGALAVTAGVTLLVYVLVEGPAAGWTSTPIVVGAVLAVVLLALFFVVESRSADPLMPLRMFGNRSLVTSMAITFMFMATFGTLPYFMTVLFQNLYGFSALQTGLAFLVPALAIAAGTQIGERLASRFSAKFTLLVGFLIGAAGTVVLAVAISADGGYGPLVPGLIIGMGIGQGTAWTGMWIAAASGVAPAEQGVAGGMASTTQQTGYAVGLAILVAIANAGLHGGDLPAAVAGGLRTAVYVTGAGILLGALIVLGLPGKKKPAPVSTVSTVDEYAELGGARG